MYIIVNEELITFFIFHGNTANISFDLSYICNVVKQGIKV